MYYNPGPEPLYRVASAAVANEWPDPVRGYGSYYLSVEGNRYSRTDQKTVYCSEDPLVAIAETAFYQALAWQKAIARSYINAVEYPLRSEHLLWVFRLDPPPVVIDLESLEAGHTFVYSPQVLLNPSRDYSTTQFLADRVRTYAPPGSGQPRAEGMKVPSVRTPCQQGFQPHQLVLIVRDSPHSMPFEQRSRLLARMKMELEFFTHAPRGPVAYQHSRINWAEPGFRVTAIPGAPSLSVVPGFPGRPQLRSYSLDRWHRIRIVF